MLTLGPAADHKVAHAVSTNFSTVPATTIKRRLQTISQLHMPPQAILETPSLYIQANRDKLVLPKKLADFQRLCRTLHSVTLTGGHFVLQENPQGSANILLLHLSESLKQSDQQLTD